MSRLLRRHRATLLVLLGVLVAVVVTVVTSRDDTPHSDDLDPDNPAPNGAQAVARVLDDQGVDVHVVRSADAFDDADVGPRTTVVVTSAWQLGGRTTDRLREHAAGARIVLVEPEAATLDAFGVHAAATTAAPDGPLTAGCDTPAYADLAIRVDVTDLYDDPTGCFRDSDGSDGSALVQPSRDLVVLGAGAALSNDEVVRADNAALALRLLGHSDRVVWYVPSFADVAPSDGVGAGALLPRWIRPALALLLVVVVALMLWRGRRLGPLVREPLPVAVKAIETTRSRGRLYRKSGDRAHAAAVLRDAARRRAADRLRLGRRPDPAVLVRDLAQHLGRPAAEVEALLGPHAPPPATDRDLITLATQLAELDREARRP